MRNHQSFVPGIKNEPQGVNRLKPLQVLADSSSVLIMEPKVKDEKDFEISLPSPKTEEIYEPQETIFADSASIQPRDRYFDQIFEKVDVADRKTQIICTLGPACWDTEMLVKMLDAGMNVARLNFSHGDHQVHARTIQNLKAALEQRPDKQCTILLDTKGPEIRTGLLKDGEPVQIKCG